MGGQYVADKISLEASSAKDFQICREDALKLLEYVKCLEESLTELLRSIYEQRQRKPDDSQAS